MVESAATELFRRRRPLRSALVAVLPLGAWCYWLAVVAPAALAATVAVCTWPQGSWQRFALLAAAASVAQLSSVQLTRRRVFHPAIVFVVAGSLLLGYQQLIVMCIVQHVPEWLKQRYRWYIQLFNIGNYVLAGLVALAAAHTVDAATGTAREATALVGLAAGSAFVLANRLLLAPMLRLARGLSLRASGLFALDDLALEFVLALMAIPLAAFWSRSVMLSILALAPLGLIQITQKAMHRVELASETINDQNEALEGANRELVQRSTAALEALSATVDARDAYTAGHSRRVRDYAVALAQELGLSEAEIGRLSQAALLHDIGKIAIPDSVLLKQGKLSQPEWMVMRSHPEQGARIIERLAYLDDVVPAIRHHHEREDGHGYPDGLRGDEIPLAARIIHVADALDAMTSKRVYRDQMTAEAALSELGAGRGTDFCPRCVDALHRAIENGRLTLAGAPLVPLRRSA